MNDVFFVIVFALVIAFGIFDVLWTRHCQRVCDAYNADLTRDDPFRAQIF